MVDGQVVFPVVFALDIGRQTSRRAGAEIRVRTGADLVVLRDVVAVAVASSFLVSVWLASGLYRLYRLFIVK